jgi:hypothetical protein
MKTTMFLALALLAMTGCRNVMLPRHPLMPIRAVTDEEDELLHNTCSVRKVVKLDNDRVEPEAVAAGANFVELLYRAEGEASVVMFACNGKPPEVGKQPGDVTE